MLECVTSCFRAKRRDMSDERRTIAPGDTQLRRQYPSNEVKSSKYNVLTFIPVNLWEQFHRPINLYFLLVAALQFIPNVAPVSPYTAIFPIVVAFLINTVKEGIDDVRRHQQDRENNSRRYTILDPKTCGWKVVQSKAIHVGDVLLLRPFEIVPSDVVVLMSSGEDGEAYTSTESLDGETGTKRRVAVLRDLYDPLIMSASVAAMETENSASRRAAASAATAGGNCVSTRSSRVDLPPPPLGELGEAVRFLTSTKICVDSEGPNPFLHTYNATLTLTTRTTANHASHDSHNRRDQRRATLPRRTSSANSFSSSDEREALLTDAAAAAADAPAEVNDNNSTNRYVSSSSHRATRSSFGVTIENVICASSTTRNTRYTLALVVFTGMETKVAMTRGTPPSKWAHLDYQMNTMMTAIFAFQFTMILVYAALSIRALGSHEFWYLGGTHMHVPVREYFPILPLRFFSMLSPMVPLSFKVMVEISKAYVSSVIRWDDDLQDGPGGEHARVTNSALAEDLGQVEYVLSDKTGTLTSNTMTLAALATADGTIYECDESKAEAHRCRHAGEIADDQPMSQYQPQRREGDGEVGSRTAPAAAAAEGRDGCSSLKALLEGMAYCNTIERSLLAGVVAPPPSRKDAKRRDKQRAPAPAPEKVWISCSPDEVALVEGVEQCGVTLVDRTRNAAEARFWDTTESVEIAKVLPFTSQRGKMSVLLRRRAAMAAQGEAEYVLLTKGSDEKVLPLCDEASHRPPSMPSTSHAHAVLEGFSLRGLRTLVYAYRNVPAVLAESWVTAVEKAEAAVTDASRAALVEEAYGQMERSLTYCGCTAVEDQLQDQVQVTLSQLRNAGIRVWMLTGDKAETARQTAVASGLLTAEDRVISLSPKETGEPLGPLAQLQHARAAVQRCLATDVELREALDVEASRSFLQRVYRGSGLKDYVDEFLSPLSYEKLKPLNHPLKYGTDAAAAAAAAASSGSTPINHSGLSTDAVDAVMRMTTLCPEVAADGYTIVDARKGYSLILSGALIELVYASSDTQLHKDFGDVLLHANTVICSRTAPDQKAKIVDVVKRAGKRTLAIGDGGNDVAMIQGAHVGVGIKGKEGNQAALSSDFAIGQFRFLARLLLVHGHTAFQRSAVIVQQSFWKSVLIAWVQLLFNLHTDFSGISFWDSYSLAIYNAIPTVPVTFLCVMDVPLSPCMLVCNPQLYRMSQRGRYLSSATFYGYVLRAMAHGTIVFLLSLGIYRGCGGLISRNGWVMDRGGDFYAAYMAVVTVHTYTVLTESHTINFAHWQCFLFSVWSCFLCFWSYASSPLLPNPTFRVMLQSPHFILTYAVLTAVVCLSLALVATVKVTWFPDLLQLQRTVGLLARSRNNTSRWAPVLRVLFEDDNPSCFWRSWSPFHAVFPCGTDGGRATSTRAAPSSSSPTSGTAGITAGIEQAASTHAADP